MIGTTSIEESHEEILYPSITICPKRYSGPRIMNVFNGTNFSIFHRTVNMSEVMHRLRYYKRNLTGHWYKEVYEPWSSQEDIREIS